MKKNKKTMSILIIAVAAVLVVVITAGILLLKHNNATSVIDNDSPGAIDLTGYPNTGDVIIRSASYLYSADGEIDGYLVSAASKGYKGMIQMDITFDNTGNIVKSVVINDQKESRGYGDKIGEAAFLNQFNGITAPVALSGEDTGNTVEDSTEEVPETSDTGTEEPLTADSGTNDDSTVSDASGTVWTDGTYEAEEADFDEQGYKDKVTLTIQNDKMTEVIWDAYNENGELKSVLSADGIYEMTKGGPTWQEQAMAITDFLVQNQSTDALTMDEEGKTDAVSGVSISVKDFVTLVKECLAKAAANEEETGTGSETADTADTPAGTGNSTDTPSVTPSGNTSDDSAGIIDAVSGATISSAAVVSGINKSQDFIKNFVLTK